MSSHVIRNLFMVTGLALLVTQVRAYGGQDTIRLELRPSAQTVFEIDTVTVSLVALSDDFSPDEISVMEVILEWDPAVLSLQGNVDPTPAMGGYEWLSSGFFAVGDFGLNQTFADGNAFYIARSQFLDPPGSAMATSSGLIVTTFEFLPVTPSAGTALDIPESDPMSGAETQVIGNIPNFNILSVTSGATVGIDPCDLSFDIDEDNDVDLADYSGFQLCFSGTGVPADILCRCILDIDADQDVDDTDYTAFEIAFTGPSP